MKLRPKDWHLEIVKEMQMDLRMVMQMDLRMVIPMPKVTDLVIEMD